MPRTLLIADDDRHFLKVLQRCLEHAGFQVLAASNGQEALALAQSQAPDACVLDVALPLLSGPDVAAQLLCPVVFISGRDWDRIGNPDTRVLKTLRKPIDVEELITLLKQALQAG